MTSKENANAVKQQDKLTSHFAARFGVQPTWLTRAPGRVNLIGEHTDYNEGFVLPCAIDREIHIAASQNPESSDTVEIVSLDYEESDAFRLSDIRHNKKNSWSNYFRGVIDALQKTGARLGGFKAAISGSVPQGAGLSSSAAEEVALANLLATMNNLDLCLSDQALVAQRAENEFVGVQCGIMDQFVSALGKADTALFLDCRSLEYKNVPLHLRQADSAIAIVNSGVRRGLVDSEYNDRRNECKVGTTELATLLNKPMKSLRDASLDEFEAVSGKLRPLVAKRCRHVISENLRVKLAVAALQMNNAEEFGRLMNLSHESLRDDFQVSCPEVDVLVELLQKTPGIHGARMTGAGFGGCVVALAARSAIDYLRNEALPQYAERTNRSGELYLCEAVNGVQTIRLN